MKILCALKDRATEAYTPIMTFHTRAEAIRSIRQTLRDKNNPISQTPTDYEMWQLAVFYEDTGTVVAFNQNGDSYKELIGRCEDYME